MNLGRRASAPEPRMRILATRPVPGWLLRAVLVTAVLGSTAVVAGTTAQVLIGAGAAAVLAWRPHALLLAVVVAVLAGMLLLAAGPPWQLHVLVLGTHLAWRTASLAAAVAWSGHVEAGVLADAARPFLGIQALAQALAVGATVLAPAAPAPWVAVGAAAALAVLSWALLMPMLTATKYPHTPRS